jgi:hypothetical protein
VTRRPGNISYSRRKKASKLPDFGISGQMQPKGFLICLLWTVLRYPLKPLMMMRRSSSTGETPLDALELSPRLLVLPILQVAKTPKVLDGTRVLISSSDRHTTWVRFERKSA